MEKLRSLLNWQGEAETRDVKGEQRSGEKDGDEKETRGLRSCWTMETESRKGGLGKKLEKGGALFT